jgi:hypothetical protein
VTTKILWLVVASAIVASGCQRPSPTDVRAVPTPRLTPDGEVVVPRLRRRTKAAPQIVNGASGVGRENIRRAVADLKTARIWRPLTRRLAVVQIQARLGRARVPRDGHLADAYWTAVVEADVVGGLCSVSFYAAAIAADRRRAAARFRHGLGPAPARRRAFWGALLAHELAHCLPGQPGERTARRWERKTLTRLDR